MKKVAITGANGLIGNVLRQGLKEEYHLTLLDKNPEILKRINGYRLDLSREYFKFSRVVSEHDLIVHLAWNTQLENIGSEKIDLNNSLMFYYVFSAAVQRKIPRVVMASSVHADDFSDWRDGLLSPDRNPTPDSPYGSSKIFMEALGRYYAKKSGLEVVCLRFGAVLRDEKNRSEERGYEKIWLSHRDCVDLV